MTTNKKAASITTEILPCKCGDYPRIRTNGGSYAEFICKTCGYISGSFYYNYLYDAIEYWNKSGRDRQKQKAKVAAFNKMVEYCNDAKGTPLEDKFIPKKFFKSLFKKTKK